MATDITFDPITREMPLTASGDMILNFAPSTQNGTIILESRCGILTNPQIGIGFNSQVLGDNVANATFELNRWASQVRNDNGLASWRSIPPPTNVGFDFEAQVNYPNNNG